MYERITDEDPYKVPMRIYPAVHYTMGGLWVDYNLMSTIPGLFVLRRGQLLRPRRQPPRRQRPDAGAGRRLLRHPVHDRQLPRRRASSARSSTDHPAFKRGRGRGRTTGSRRLLAIKGKRTVDTFHRELGKIMWDYCGMARTEEGLKTALEKIPALREEFWQNVSVLGDGDELNQSLEKAGRVADFLELGELLCLDALERRESCGGHFREEYQTPDGEALRDDENFCHVAAWEYTGDGQPPDPARRAADVRERPAPDAELQVIDAARSAVNPSEGRPMGGDHGCDKHAQPHPERLAPEEPRSARAGSSPTRPATSAPTCRSWRCSTSSTRG